jgi:hypothetical protein
MSHENKPNNIKALTSPAIYNELAALVVVAAVAEPLVLLADPLEVPVAVPLALELEPEPELLLLELSVPRTPPMTPAGVLVSLALAAALLNEARVSEPLELWGK